MPPMSFWNISYRGFVSFGEDLRQRPWTDIPDPDPAQPILRWPVLVGLKHRVERATESVLNASGNYSTVRQTVSEWGRCQTRLHAQIVLDEAHRLPERRAAAGRLRIVLLSGDGTAQKILPPDHQVDFGASQILLCAKEAKVHADILFLDYQSLIDDIEQATQQLALAMGRNILGSRPLKPSLRIRKAVRAAAREFRAVHENIEYYLGVTAEGTPDHALLKMLWLSLQYLLERHAKPAVDDGPAT